MVIDKQVIQVFLELFGSDAGDARRVFTDVVVLQHYAVVGGARQGREQYRDCQESERSASRVHRQADWVICAT